MNEQDTAHVPDDELNQELVAYLDGELDEESGRRIERRLSEDADYRLRLQHLQRAWDMLDYLPRAHVAESFTQSTVEMVVLSATEDVQQLHKRTSQRRGLLWLVGGGSFLAATLLGYALVASLANRPNRQLVQQLPLIENYDLYRHADSLTFLDQLRDSRLFDDQIDDSLGPIVDEPLQVRATRLDTMDAAAKDELQRNKARFDELSKEQQEQLRKLHEELTVSPESQRYHQILVRYERLLRSLPSNQRAQLLTLPPDDRINQISQILREQERERFRELASRLPPQDRDTIYDWFSEVSARREAELLELIPEDARNRVLATQDDRRRRSIMFFHLLRPRPDSPPGQEEWLVRISKPQDIQALIIRLSPEAQASYADFQDSRQKLLLVRGWIFAALYSKRPPRVPQEELTRFFDKLSAEKQAYLEALPSDRMQRELEMMYHRSNREPFFGKGRPRGSDGSGRGPFREGGHRGPPRGDNPPGEPTKSPPPPSKDPAPRAG